MKQVTLDGNYISSAAQIHEILARELSFPEYYGRNLDALYDCLTDLSEETSIRLCNVAELDRMVPQYSARLLRVLQDAAEENGRITVTVG